MFTYLRQYFCRHVWKHVSGVKGIWEGKQYTIECYMCFKCKKEKIETK